MAKIILHLTQRSEWEAAKSAGAYQGNTLYTEGFIHCSLPSQLIGVANALYRGREGLVVLCIDAARLRSEVRYEDCYETGQAFPHVYGPLNPDAVIEVVEFVPRADGSFEMPEALEKYLEKD